MGIEPVRTHGKASSCIKKLKLIKAKPLLQNYSKHQHPKNKVTHQETFTIPSYQVKKAKIHLAVHSVLTHTTQRTKEKHVKLTKVLFPDSKIPEQLELGRTKLSYLLQFGLASHYKLHTCLIISSYWLCTKICILL